MWHFRVVPVWNASQLCSTAHGPLPLIAERCIVLSIVFRSHEPALGGKRSLTSVLA